METPTERGAIKVLHVIPTLNPHYGGPSEAMRLMTRALAREGVHTEVATTLAPKEKSSSRSDTSQATRSGVVRHHVFTRRPQTKWSFSLPLGRWVRSQVSQYDLLHVHTLFCYPSLVAAREARRARVPYLVRPCGMLDPWPLGQKSWRKRIYYLLCERASLRCAAAIHCTSPLEADNLTRLGYAEKVRTVPLGVALPARGQERRTRRGPLRILFLSRLHPKKGLPDLLEAAATLRNEGSVFRLRVAGSGSADYEVHLRQHITRLELEDSVELVGFVQGEEKHRELEQADVFVLPSYHENMGLAVLEAMASALPVVITDQVAFSKDILEAGAGRVVRVRSPGALAEAIRALGNPRQRLKAARNARRLVEARFTSAHMARALVKLYRETWRESCGPEGP